MKFVIIAHRNQDADPSKFTPELLAEDAKVATEYLADDFIREIYNRTDGQGSVIVVEAESEAAVQEKLGNLPLAKEGLLSVEVYGVNAYGTK